MNQTWRNAGPIFLLGWAVAVMAGSASAQVIFDMDSVVHQPGTFAKDGKQVPAGAAQVVDGKFAKAVRFTFVEGAAGGFMTGRVRPDQAWSKSDGFSFWVKGDGSRNWGGIELIDRDDFGLRYGYCFPIDSTDWKKISVRWNDLTPELAGPMVDPKTGYDPAHFGNFWFGKWFYWRDFPAESYTIDQVELEPTIAAPPTLADAPQGLKQFARKLRDHQPVTIVTMGDSLSDSRHWSNHEILWSQLLKKKIKDKYGSDVTVVNPAIGGTTLSQNMVLMPRWSTAAPRPDLVTVWFGGNDWATNVRGERFAQYLRVAVDRIRQQTGGSASVLLMTTNPSHDAWDSMAELEKAVREVAAEKKTGLVDIAAEFRRPGSADESLKQEYWAWDKVHLGAKGHNVVAESILKAIDAAQ